MAVDTREAPAARRRARPYDMLVDVDVHPIMRDGIEILLPYMSKRWREVFSELPPIPPPSGVTMPFPYAENTLTPDAMPPDQGPPGSDPKFMVEDFFDRYDVGIGQLIMLEAFASTAYVSDPDMEAALISAYNDWMLDSWVIDPRMRHALLVTTTDPALAAAEIRRLGPDPRVCSVCLGSPAPGRSLGHSYYHPIFDVAVEHALPVHTHSASGGFRIPGESYVEMRVNIALGAWVQVNSLVLQGTLSATPSSRSPSSRTGSRGSCR